MSSTMTRLDTADELARWLRIHPRTIRQWARRGHITRHDGDLYDSVQLADYLDRRDTRMLDVRRGLQTSRSAP